jgi:hypothetical protein
MVTRARFPCKLIIIVLISTLISRPHDLHAHTRAYNYQKTFLNEWQNIHFWMTSKIFPPTLRLVFLVHARARLTLSIVRPISYVRKTSFDENHNNKILCVNKCRKIAARDVLYAKLIDASSLQPRSSILRKTVTLQHCIGDMSRCPLSLSFPLKRCGDYLS